MLGYRYQMTVLARSEFAVRLEVALSLAIAGACYMLTDSLVHRLSIAALVSISTLLVCAITYRKKLADFQLHINDSGELAIINDLSARKIVWRGKVSPASYATSQFCLLKVTVTNNVNVQRYLIWKDSLDDQSFRRLSRIIRLARHQI